MSESASSVRDAILERAANPAPHGARVDGRRIALCVEGGAMRGVVSAGMVLAVEQLGLLSTFDCVYGSSAGAINAAYLLARQAAFGTSIYYSDINNHRFISRRRGLTGGAVADLDFLVSRVMTTIKPLDTAAILESPIPFAVIATNATTGAREILRDFASGEDLRGALRASSTMPFVAAGPFKHRDTWFFDAMVTEPIPLRAAEEDGCTDIVALMTRPTTADPPARAPFMERRYVLPRLAKRFPNCAASYARRTETYYSLLKHVGETGRGPLDIARVLPVIPRPPVVSKLECDRDRLIAGAAAGMQAVFEAFLAPAGGTTILQGFDRAGRRLTPEMLPRRSQTRLVVT